MPQRFASSDRSTEGQVDQRICQRSPAPLYAARSRSASVVRPSCLHCPAASRYTMLPGQRRTRLISFRPGASGLAHRVGLDAPSSCHRATWALAIVHRRLSRPDPPSSSTPSVPQAARSSARKVPHRRRQRPRATRFYAPRRRPCFAPAGHLKGLGHGEVWRAGLERFVLRGRQVSLLAFEEGRSAGQRRRHGRRGRLSLEDGRPGASSARRLLAHPETGRGSPLLVVADEGRRRRPRRS